MPIYTYRCDNCGVRFERNQKFSDPPLARCSECGKKSLRKVYVPVGIVFKGSGFYATDHRSPSGSSRASSEEKLHDKQAEAKKSEDSAGSAASTTGAPPAASSGSES
ncbi:MAG TPA: zinc ribbon domain-containing protein [Levilinea sp.]|nr:zinc ribbon domain-containing protein [Levilinea sp.]